MPKRKKSFPSSHTVLDNSESSRFAVLLAPILFFGILLVPTTLQSDPCPAYHQLEQAAGQPLTPCPTINNNTGYNPNPPGPDDTSIAIAAVAGVSVIIGIAGAASSAKTKAARKRVKTIDDATSENYRLSQVFDGTSPNFPKFTPPPQKFYFVDRSPTPPTTTYQPGISDTERQALVAQENSEWNQMLDESATQVGGLFAQVAEDLLPSYLGQNEYVDRALDWVGTQVAETYAADPLREVMKMTEALNGQTPNGVPLTGTERTDLLLEVGKSELKGHITNLFKEKAFDFMSAKVQGMLFQEALPPPVNISSPNLYLGKVDAGDWNWAAYQIHLATRGPYGF